VGVTAAIDVFLNKWQPLPVFTANAYQGVDVVNTTTTGHATSKTFRNKFFLDPCNAKDPKKTIVKEITFDISKAEFIYKQKSWHHE
jgi:hypothetical protein